MGSPTRMSDLVEVGQRVSFFRRRKGLTQYQLSKTLGRYPAWAGAVERGEYRLERVDMLIKVAEALDITVADLRPDIVPSSDPVPDSDPTGLVSILASYPTMERLSILELVKLEDRITTLYQLGGDADHQHVQAELAELLPLAEHTSDLRQMEVYELAARVLIAARELPAGWVAADRAITAAHRTGDKTRTAATILRSSRMFASAGHWTQARASAQSALDSLPIDPARPSSDLALAGTAHLILAEDAAHRTNRGTANHHLDQAADLAKRAAGADFNPGAVACHQVTVAVILHDAGDAIQIAQQINTEELSGEHHARLCLDLARAEIQRRSFQRALSLLHKAAELDPDLIAHDPTASAALDDLVGLTSRGDGVHLDQLRAHIRSPH